MYNTTHITAQVLPNFLRWLSTLILLNFNVYAEEQIMPAHGTNATGQQPQIIELASGTKPTGPLPEPICFDKWGKIRVKVDAKSHFYIVDNTKFLPSSDKYEMNRIKCWVN